jgi:hypothetical protein
LRELKSLQKQLSAALSKAHNDYKAAVEAVHKNYDVKFVAARSNDLL